MNGYKKAARKTRKDVKKAGRVAKTNIKRTAKTVKKGGKMIAKGTKLAAKTQRKTSSTVSKSRKYGEVGRGQVKQKTRFREADAKSLKDTGKLMQDKPKDYTKTKKVNTRVKRYVPAKGKPGSIITRKGKTKKKR